MAEDRKVLVVTREASSSVLRSVFEGNGGAGSNMSTGSTIELMEADENKTFVTTEVESSRRLATFCDSSSHDII